MCHNTLSESKIQSEIEDSRRILSKLVNTESRIAQISLHGTRYSTCRNYSAFICRVALQRPCNPNKPRKKGLGADLQP